MQYWHNRYAQLAVYLQYKRCYNIFVKWMEVFMNIFYLDPQPRLCAQYHCDKHVVKMILEYAQLLSTAHRIA